MNEIIEAVRTKYPDAYKDVDDDRLSLAIAINHPVYLKTNDSFRKDVERINAEHATPGHGATFAREAAAGVLPTAAGAGGAVGTGALVGALGAGPVGMGIGALVGGLISGIGAEKAQSAMLDEYAPEFQRQRARGAEAHPWTAAAGMVASGAPSMVISPGNALRSASKLVRGVATKAEAIEAAAPLAIGAATSAGTPMLMEGRVPTMPEVVAGMAQSVIYGQPRRWVGGPKAPLVPRVVGEAGQVPATIEPIDAVEGRQAGGFQQAEPMPERAQGESPLGGRQRGGFTQDMPPEIPLPVSRMPELQPPVADTTPTARGGLIEGESPEQIYGGREPVGPPRPPGDIVLSRSRAVSPEGEVVPRQAGPFPSVGEGSIPIVERQKAGSGVAPSSPTEPPITGVSGVTVTPSNVRAPQPAPYHSADAGTGGVSPFFESRGAATGGSVPSRIAAKVVPESARVFGRAAGNVISEGVSLYSEPIMQRLQKLAKGNLPDGIRNIPARAKQLLAGLSSTLDDAMTHAGKLSDASTWLRGFKAHKDGMGVSNLHTALEGNPADVPSYAVPLVEKVKAANLAIGKLAEKLATGFVATGKMQKNLTRFGFDVIQRGGEMLDRWATFVARENPVEAGHLLAALQKENKVKAGATPLDAVKYKFDELRREMATPGASTARLQNLNQEFSRLFQNTPTHIHVAGSGWHELVHSAPIDYLKNAANRTSHAAAFREVFDPKSGALGKARMDFLEKAGGHAEDFDTAMRALQGMPQPLPAKLPSTNPAVIALKSTFQTVMNLMSKAVLTGNFVTNLPETFVGATGQYLGYGYHLKALLKHRELYNALEQTGAVNKLFYDNSWDNNSKLRSAARILGNGISKVSAQQFLNEAQEAIAATAARLVTDDIRNGTLSAWSKSRLPHTLEVMGFSEKEAAAIMAGDAKLLHRFEVEAAPFLTGGNMATAEGSRMFNSRMFNTLFRFQSYPMMKLNQFRSAWDHFLDVRDREGGYFKATPDGKAEIRRSFEMLSRNVLGTAVQGAGTALLASLAFGGIEGLKLKGQEAQDAPGRFFADSLFAALGGPFYIMVKALQRAGKTDLANQIGQLVFPYNMAVEMLDVTFGQGQYADLMPLDRIDKFLFERLPGGRAAQQALALAGLSSYNSKLAADMRAFRLWKGREMGWRQEEIGRWEDDNRQFRTGMKQVMDAITRGESIIPGLKVATGNSPKPVTYSQLAASVRGRTLLRSLDGSPLTTDQMTRLISRIGNDAYKRLAYHDAKLNLIARALAAGGDAPAVDSAKMAKVAGLVAKTAGNPMLIEKMAGYREKARQYGEKKKASLFAQSPMSPLNAPIYPLPVGNGQ